VDSAVWFVSIMSGSFGVGRLVLKLSKKVKNWKGKNEKY
jgi:hypothetical protein